MMSALTPHKGDEPTDRSMASTIRWQIVIMMMAFSFMNYFNRQSLPVAAVERIMKEYSVDEERMGFAYSAFLATYTLAMVPGGWLVDRFGPKKTLVWLGFGTALAAMATGLWGHATLASSGSLSAIMISRGVMGIFSAPIYPACARMASHWLPEHRRALATGLIIGSAPVGISATVYVFGILMELMGWPLAFVISGIATASVTIVWVVFASDTPAAHSRVNDAERRLISGSARAAETATVAVLAEHDGSRPESFDGSISGRTPSAWRGLFTSRSLILLTISYVTVGYFEYLIYYWMQYYFETVLGLPKDDSRFYSAIPPLAMALGFPLGGWVTDRLRVAWGPRWGRSVVAMVSMVLSAIALIAVPFAREPFWLVIWFSIALGMTGASDVLFWTVAIELGGKRGGTAAAICNFGGNVGGTIAPAISPVIANFINNGRTTLPAMLLIFGDGWSTALAVGSLLCMAGVVLWFWVDPTEAVA